MNKLRIFGRITALSLFALGLLHSSIGPSIGYGSEPQEGGSQAVANTSIEDLARTARQILSDRCFVCHGPDAAARQADLRLDQTSALAKAEASNGRLIVASSRNDSELWRRIASSDADEVMPPSDSKLSLTPDERESLGQWLEAGTPSSTIWSLLPIPKSIAVPPEPFRETWSRNAIDRFVGQKLSENSLQPNSEADPLTLLRRATILVTGLPPTEKEVRSFAVDNSPDSYERLVDRLLARPAAGENLAQPWLDLARYADTHGYQADRYREVWAYRDFVVKSINDDLPVDQFLTWQLAGDMLPDATLEQRVATAFNRLHRQNEEGGSVEEEFRVEYVTDRVNTFGTAMLGLTLQCCRCHDHKYDPVTQEEYYQLCAFFDNIDESGLTSHFTDAMPGPTTLLVDRDTERKISKLQQEEQLLSARMRKAANHAAGSDEFDRYAMSLSELPKSPTPSAIFSMDETDGTALVNGTAKDHPGKIEDNAIRVGTPWGRGFRIDGDSGLLFPKTFAPKRTDSFSIRMRLLVPALTDRAVLAHRSRAWHDAASRGWELLIEDGKLSFGLIHFWPSNAIRIVSSENLPIGEWIEVVATYDGSSRASGACLYVNGQKQTGEVIRDSLWKDIVYERVEVETAIGSRFRDRGFKDGQVDEFAVYEQSLTPWEVWLTWQKTRNQVAQTSSAKSQESNDITGPHGEFGLEPEKGKAVDKATESSIAATVGDQLAEHWRALLKRELPNEVSDLPDSTLSLLRNNYAIRQDSRVLALQEELKKLRRQLSELLQPIPELMTMEEMPVERPTHFLNRGAYDTPGKVVSAATPICLPPMNKAKPSDRLGLAHWLVDADHPLTARVAVNGWWQSLMGRGIVATPEDFGSQGQVPTHPQLLDYLARRLMNVGWSRKRILREILLSATFRQSSAWTQRTLSQDRETIWLSRFRSNRMSAEQIRDAALAASGLLSRAIGGAPVYPYQPPGLWEEKSGKTYPEESGEGLVRRSLYTFLKRTSPQPSALVFDATSREACVARRETTASPLQTLVLVNDPQFVEACRYLARSCMSDSPLATPAGTGDPEEAALKQLFVRLVGRDASIEEALVLRELYEFQLERFTKDTEGAKKLLETGKLKFTGTVDWASVAALTMVATAIVSSDLFCTVR